MGDVGGSTILWTNFEIESLDVAIGSLCHVGKNTQDPLHQDSVVFFAANTLLALLLRYEDSTEGPILLSDNRKSKCSIGAPFTDARISQDS